MESIDQLFLVLESPQFEIIAEVALAMLLGGLIGIEREWAAKPAGFRTHMMIAGAAALLVGLGDSLLETFLFNIDNQGIRSDPIRIVEAVITGVSFLGAGTIFRRDEDQVKGLTTAASLLLTSAIGICVALSEFGLSISITLLTLFVLRGLRFLEGRIKNHNTRDTPNGQDDLAQELRKIRQQIGAIRKAQIKAEREAKLIIKR